MASFRCYGNSDLGEMYPIWNFHLSLAHHLFLIFFWVDNGGALVAQSWTVSLPKNHLITSHLNMIKKHSGRGNFVLFSNLFPHFREHPIVSKLKQDSCHKVHASLHKNTSVHWFSSYFHFSLFVSKSNMKFCPKIFRYRSFSIITGHGTEKGLLMKFEILGLTALFNTS